MKPHESPRINKKSIRGNSGVRGLCGIGVLENKLFQLDIYFLEATETSNFSVYSCQGNTKLYAKYMNAIFEVISFIGDVYLTCLRTSVGGEFW